MKFYYTNYKGETELRTVKPLALEYVSAPNYGYEPGWFLRAFDISRNAERSFRIDARMTPHIDPETGLPEGTEIGDLASIKGSVDDLAKHGVENPPGTQTSAGMAAIAADWMNDTEEQFEEKLLVMLADREQMRAFHNNLKSVSASVLRNRRE